MIPMHPKDQCHMIYIKHLFKNKISTSLHFLTALLSYQETRCPSDLPNWISNHYSDVIMGAIASQITSPTIVYSTDYSDADQRKHQSSASLAFFVGNSPWTCALPAQMASNAENVSIWWRHRGILRSNTIQKVTSCLEWCYRYWNSCEL